MPNFKILFRADLTNIAEVGRPSGCTWGLKVECTKCHEKTENFQYVDPNDEEETQGGGKANHFSHCKFCKNGMSISVVPRSENAYVGEDTASLITLDCRGCEPIEVELDDAWVATAINSDAKFTEGVNLAEEWCDYDEKGSQEVGIANPQFTFQRTK